MIVFDLVCTGAHRFEAWFGSGSDFDDQKARGLLSCPFCGSTQVDKAAMAPAVPAKSNQATRAARPNDDPAARLLALQRALEDQSDYVGSRFAEEARAIHAAGEQRCIHGEASLADVKSLHDDGIPLLPLPFRPRAGSDA